MKRFKPTTKTIYLSFFMNAKVYNMRSGVYVLGYVSEDGYNYEQQLVDIKLISDITKMSAVNFLRELKKKAINCVI